MSVCLFSKKGGDGVTADGATFAFRSWRFLRRPPVTQLFRQAIGCWACRDMGVSLNGGTPKPPILIGFSIINHPYWDTTISGNPHIPIDLHVVIHQKLSDTRYLNSFLLHSPNFLTNGCLQCVVVLQNRLLRDDILPWNLTHKKDRELRNFRGKLPNRCNSSYKK